MTSSLGLRFSERLEGFEAGRTSGRLDSGKRGPLVVAVSGGLDSCVLLHLLRFAVSRRNILVAHFDHRMRPESADDARWLSGLCLAWGLPCVMGVADSPPRSEDEARQLRYAFLESTRDEAKGSVVLTAHHADDQAETVLFRVLRGTGLAGLQGIPTWREPGIFRPLLPFWREELEEYASAVGLSWRVDSTNTHLGYARNTLRHAVLPLVESTVAPGARRALVRLAQLAADDERAWDAVMPGLLSEVDAAPTGDGGQAFDHSAFMAFDGALRRKVLRHIAGTLGRVPDRALTEQAVHFVSKARSGSRFPLGGDIEIRRELERVVVAPARPVRADEPLHITGTGPGAGDAIVGGRALHVTWASTSAPPIGEPGEEGGEEGTVHAYFPEDVLDFPLILRSRRPGDRIRLGGGSRKVKKVLLDSRIPPGERDRVPLLVDGAGRVLWIAGVVRASDLLPQDDGQAMRIEIQG